MFQMTPYNHAVNAMAISQFHGTDRQISVVGGPSVLEYDLLEDVWGFKYSERWMQTLVLIAFAGGFIIFAMCAAKFIRFVK